MIQSAIVEKHLLSCLFIIEDGDRYTPRSLSRNAPITAARYKSIDAVLSDIWNPLNL
jgi:hypothetical protein